MGQENGEYCTLLKAIVLISEILFECCSSLGDCDNGDVVLFEPVSLSSQVTECKGNSYKSD